MLGWGISDFFAKKSVDKVGHVASIFWMQFLGLIPLIIVFLIQSKPINFDLSLVLPIIVLGLIDGLGYLLFYRALEKGKASIVSPIVASYAVLSIIVAKFFLAEVLSTKIILILLLVFIGIIILSIDFEELKKKKDRKWTGGIVEAIIAALLFSVWFPFWGKLVVDQDWLIMLILLRLVMSGFLFTVIKATKTQYIIKSKMTFSWLIIIALLDSLAYFVLTWGYGSTSYISVVTIMSSIYSLPTLVLAWIFLKERLNKFQYVGIGLILFGIAALAFFGQH